MAISQQTIQKLTFVLLKNLRDFEIKFKKIGLTGILGPNGCGKTTLFSMCIGEQNPDNGKIILKNKSIEQIPIHLRAKEGLGDYPTISLLHKGLDLIFRVIAAHISRL